MSAVWLITGSSRGLGRALATAVLTAGHRLVATARRAADLDDLVAAYGDRVRAVALDVTDPAAACAAVAVATSAFGRLDVVVNNAGYAHVHAVEDVAADDFRAQIETDFFGVVHVTRAALPVMRAQGSGHLIQISSIGGRVGTPGLSAYQAAKWAVGGFSEALATEVAPLGIRVTVAEPGSMRTEFAGGSMRVDAVQPAYQATVGVAAAQYRGHGALAQSDPAKVAQVLLRVAAMPEPPLHLLLGSNAIFLAGVFAAARAAEDAAWRATSLSTDADGLPDFAETPMAQLLIASTR